LLIVLMLDPAHITPGSNGTSSDAPARFRRAGRADRSRGSRRQHDITDITSAPIDLRENDDDAEWAPPPELRIAVLLPCRDEAITIGRVVEDFRTALPTADIYVYDNASSDATAEVAAAAGAIVRRVPTPGKGNVLRRMFSEVDASVYVLADGDGTYDASAAPRLIHRMQAHQLEMVVGRRVEHTTGGAAYRRGHRLGNRFLSHAVQWLFGAGPIDMLSGYRVFSRRYVKSFPALARAFEAETEMTIHALDLHLSFEEVAVDYCERPPASNSKLRTIPDGLRILFFILFLLKDYRPLRFFGTLACISAAGALAAGPGRHLLPDWAAKPGVGVACIVLAALFLVAGVIVDSVSHSRREMKRIMFLSIGGLSTTADEEPTQSSPDGFPHAAPRPLAG
jgi:hypothetical protein